MTSAGPAATGSSNSSNHPPAPRSPAVAAAPSSLTVPSSQQSRHHGVGKASSPTTQHQPPPPSPSPHHVPSQPSSSALAAPQQQHGVSPPSKRDLKSWWKGFKLQNRHQESHGRLATATSPITRARSRPDEKAPGAAAASRPLSYHEASRSTTAHSTTIPLSTCRRSNNGVHRRESVEERHSRHDTAISHHHSGAYSHRHSYVLHGPWDSSPRPQQDSSSSAAIASAEPSSGCRGGGVITSAYRRVGLHMDKLSHISLSQLSELRRRTREMALSSVRLGADMSTCRDRIAETELVSPSTEPKPQGIFGVPLQQSITYANVAISLVDENGQSYIYGYVPIVVAKCGVFLKEKGRLMHCRMSSRSSSVLAM